jgi:hypothetical protein
MCLGLLDPHPALLFIWTDPDLSINKRNMKKNLDFYCFVNEVPGTGARNAVAIIVTKALVASS